MAPDQKQNENPSPLEEAEERPPVTPEELEEMLNQLAEAKKEALASQEVKFVRPPHKIKDKVSLSPTGVNPQTLEQADKVLASLGNEYLSWVHDDLQKLQDIYDRLAATSAAEAKPVLQEVFALVHDMKGQGGTFGYTLVTIVGNMLCRLIERLEDRWRTSYLAVIKVHVDTLRLIIAKEMAGDGGKEGEHMLKGLEATITKTLQGHPDS